MKLTYQYKLYSSVQKLATIEDWQALLRRQYDKVVAKDRFYSCPHCGKSLYYDACTSCRSPEGGSSSGAAALTRLLRSRRYWRCSRYAKVRHQQSDYHNAAVKVKQLAVVHPVPNQRIRELKREPVCASVRQLGGLRMSLDID